MQKSARQELLTGSFINGTLHQLVNFHRPLHPHPVFSSLEYTQILRRRSNLHGWISFPSLLFFPFSSPFFFFFSSSFRQSSRRNVRERERERGRHELVLFRDAPYYNGPPRAGEHPVESHSRMCLRTLGFLSKLKTNSSHLCHRWHNNHLCLPFLLLLLSLVPPSFLESAGFCFHLFFYMNFYIKKDRSMNLVKPERSSLF